MTKTFPSERLLALIRSGEPINLSQRLSLTARLALPAIIAQMSSIVMQYIDAAMVGSLGAEPSASIGLVSTTTWLFSGLCSAVVAGFSVQVAHYIGANEFKSARDVLRQAFSFTLLFSVALSLLGVLISGHLPVWLGGDQSICGDASDYFRIYSLFLPVLQMYFLSSSMLRYSGNMRVPGAMGVLMCILDVVFNFFLIFPSRPIVLFGFSLTLPGAGLGVRGAALGTGAAICVVSAVLLLYLVCSSKSLKLLGERKFLSHGAGHTALGSDWPSYGAGTSAVVWRPDYLHGDSRSAWSRGYRGQFFGCDCRKPLLYARIWRG